VDLIFSFFSHKFNIPKTVKAIPVIASFGFLVYSLWPFFVPEHVYVGLVIGTVIFSAASGLAEVLISPVIAAIPSDDPDREMSKLHSIYAWGVVFVIAVSTVFLLLAGSENWQWLALSFTLIPLVSAFLFFGSEIPHMDTPKQASGALKLLKNKGVWLSVFAIFLGGAAECTMAQWSSGYLEKALGIPKVWGDLLGVAAFSVMLGLGRSLYAKIGRNIEKVLILGAVGASLCYFTVAISNIAWLGLVACALTGFCVSMLWPGNLIVAADKFPESGVFIYAIMASGGDLGASVAPQLVGIITDAAIANPAAVALAESLALSPEQFAMKLGMFFAMLFPIAAIFVYLRIAKNKRKDSIS
jgi:MFS family permease